MRIVVTVQPAAGVAPAISGVSAEVSYRRQVSGGPGAPDTEVPSSVRFSLDNSLTGSVTLEDAAGPELQVAILAVDGSAILSRTMQAQNGVAAVTISAAEAQQIAAAPQAIPANPAPVLVTRTARLIKTGTEPVDFARSRVMVTPIASQAALNASPAAALLTQGGAVVSALEVTGGDLTALSQMPWNPALLAADGTITATFENQRTAGWSWWLVGDHQVLGFVPDDLSADDTRIRVLPLPALAVLSTSVSVTDDSCSCRSRVPTDVSETELANNPGLYTEDPGAFCRPFSSPERVLGERSFSVIARATQPAIGPGPSAKGKVMSLLTLEGDSALPTGNFFTRVGDRLRSASAALATIPVRHVLPVQWGTLVGSLPAARAVMDADHPLQWEDEISQYQAASVAIGHILEFRVRWRSNGYSLGNVAKTLTLAPRQVKRIQKIEWERRQRARRAETTQLRDQENDSIVRERDYQDMVAAHLDEWARGGSSSDTEAIAGGIGFFFAGVLGGIGGGAGSAHSSSHQEGGRDTTASEQQRLRDSIRRHGDALRRLESTVVTEVTEEESVTGTTEVIRNANYAHSLTVIYYQILRHLKISTGFAGVRECLFIPFAIKPFDIQRAYRWREPLQVAIRSPLYSRALRYLKDVATNFATSDIPAGPRANQQLAYVRGSLYIELAIERPADSADGLFDALRWAILQPMLGMPAFGIYNTLLVLTADSRDRQFQTAYAPGIAAKWSDRLQLRVGNRVLRADFTLASRYQFNRSVRVDFSIAASDLGGLSRASLQQLTVVAGQGLPPGSVANLTRLSLIYNTQRFEHGVEGRSGTNDLVAPGTGAADSATAVLPLDDWERVDERLEITRSVNQLIEHLNEHVEYYHKAIWWRMDRDRLLMLLDGFYVPNTNGVSIASVVDREPIGVIGNSLVYRVGAASFLGLGSIRTPAQLYDLYAERQPVNDPMLVGLPTDGLYAQTIMDECAALEEHYGNVDWVLAEKEPDLGTIDPSLLQSRRQDPTAGTTPTTFPGTIINLQNAPEAPAPSGLAGVLNAVTNPNAFRDMAGLAATQANAMGALNTAASLATNFGNQAAQLEMAKIAKAEQGTRSADQKLASIRSAVDRGLATPADGAQAARDTLAAMNPDAPRARAPHEDPMINSVIGAARSAPGSTIEASTGEGAVKVSMGDTSGMLASAGQPIQQLCGFFATNVVVTEAYLRDAVRVAAEAEHTDWFPAAGALMEDDPAVFGKLVQYWLCRTGDIRPLTLTALQAQAVSAAINYGLLNAAATTPAQVNAEVTRVRGDLLAGVPGAATPGLDLLVESALRDARTSGVIVPANNRQAWSAVFVVSTVRRTGIGLTLESEDGGAHVGKNVLLLAHPGHRGYVIEADSRRKAGIGGTYHAFAAADRVLKVGDIIIQDRQAATLAGVWTFANIPALVGGRELHGDIVISVNPGAGDAITIGGNLGNSVRRRRYPITADGTLVIERTQLYTQEDGAGNLPTVPVINPAAGLNGSSTGRIFAVLSPVNQCIVIPGQQLGGGVVA